MSKKILVFVFIGLLFLGTIIYALFYYKTSDVEFIDVKKTSISLGLLDYVYYGSVDVFISGINYGNLTELKDYEEVLRGYVFFDPSVGLEGLLSYFDFKSVLFTDVLAVDLLTAVRLIKLDPIIRIIAPLSSMNIGIFAKLNVSLSNLHNYRGGVFSEGLVDLKPYVSKFFYDKNTSINIDNLTSVAIEDIVNYNIVNNFDYLIVPEPLGLYLKLKYSWVEVYSITSYLDNEKDIKVIDYVLISKYDILLNKSVLISKFLFGLRSLKQIYLSNVSFYSTLNLIGDLADGGLNEYTMNEFLNELKNVTLTLIWRANVGKNEFITSIKDYLFYLNISDLSDIVSSLENYIYYI